MIRIQTALFGLCLALALGAVVLVWRAGGHEQAFDSAVPAQASLGAPFKLIDQNGHVRSDRDFRGRWLLVYFGYTYCPDVCPTTLQTIADAFRGLGRRAQRFVPVFVTLDPERDQPAVLRRYLAAFGPEFVGLTGSTAQIAVLTRAYHVYYAKHPLTGGGYSIDHASQIYLMAPDGRFAALLDEQQGAAALAKELASRS